MNTEPASITIYDPEFKRLVTVVDREPLKGENGWWVPLHCTLEEALAYVVGGVAFPHGGERWNGTTDGIGWGPCAEDNTHHADDEDRCVAIIVQPELTSLTVGDIRGLIAAAEDDASIELVVEDVDGFGEWRHVRASIEDGMLVMIARGA